MTSTVLDDHREFVERFAGALLDDYIDRLQRLQGGRWVGHKEFNDPVWGTLVVHPIEVVVLDSPLLQRLRRIRQLGVVHLIYPGAVHTRFEHTIGVLHQVQRLIEAVNNGAVRAHRSGPLLDDGWQQTLRLAALVHDIGHGAMSHVSENALRNHGAAEDLRLAFEEEVARVKLGELNSYLLIGTSAFGRLLEEAQHATGTTLPDAVQEKLQQIVVGQTVRDDIPFLHEFITGPFDADKLDYMTRDARASGVPEATDVNRLLRKVRAVDLPPDQLPEGVRSDVRLRDTVTVVAIARSGSRTLDELTLARTLMFDKIYRHQKVRAAEAMVGAIFRQLASVVKEPLGAVHLALTLPDSDLLEFRWDSTPVTELVDRGSAAYRATRGVVDDLVCRLRERRLFHRAISFSSRMPSDPYIGYSEHTHGLGQLLRELDSDREACNELAADIASAAEEALRLTDPQLLDEHPGKSLQPYVCVDPPRSLDNPRQTLTALLVTSDGTLIPFVDEAPETADWALAYSQTRDVGYVFAPREVVAHVGLAAERLLYERYRVRIPPWMLATGVAQARIADLRRQLNAEGFYDRSSWTLRPRPPVLEQADFPRRRESITKLLAGYHGPEQGREHLGKEAIHPRRVENFVMQFGDDDMIDAALRMLAALCMVRRADFERALHGLLQRHEEFRQAHVVPLGEPKDSGGQAAYFMLDAQKEYPGLRAVGLEYAITADAPIVFVDDYVGSGNQAASIVEAWFGNLDRSRSLGEERRTLPQSLQRELRSRPLAFVFAAAMTEGLRNLASAARAVGLTVADVRARVVGDDIPRAFSSVDYRDNGQRARFQARCEKVGAQLLADVPPEQRDQRVLGYGNDALLLVFPYNTPTHTMTLLWKAGEVDGRPWEPLLPRRKKR